MKFVFIFTLYRNCIEVKNGHNKCIEITNAYLRDFFLGYTSVFLQILCKLHSFLKIFVSDFPPSFFYIVCKFACGVR